MNFILPIIVIVPHLQLKIKMVRNFFLSTRTKKMSRMAGLTNLLTPALHSPLPVCESRGKNSIL